MPKVIELTVELDVQRVSCPGVWLCQDGRVSLTVFALGTSYQTCLLHPIFPLMFKDVFYFRKRFHETCSLNNICCLLKNETIYCELVQWCEDCQSGGATVLAQYLGTLNDILFPPNMCSNEGVDLLMRRSRDFPGILSPKVEITTKVRIDEVWDTGYSQMSKPMKVKSCNCDRDTEGVRQKQVCHSPMYHRVRCTKRHAYRSRSRSSGSRSLCSLNKESDAPCEFRKPRTKSRQSVCPSSRRHCPEYQMYNVATPTVDSTWRDIAYNVNRNGNHNSDSDCDSRLNESADLSDDVAPKKPILESNYIDQEHSLDHKQIMQQKEKKYKLKISPCVCEICKRYHQLFHSNCTKTES